MGTQYYRGDRRPLLQSFTRKSSPVNGYIEEASYKGLSEWEFRDLADYMFRNGFEYDWDTTHGVHTLRAVDTSGAITIDTWEIGVNKMSPSIYKNPVTTRAIMDGDSLTWAEALVVLNSIQSIEAGETVTTAGGDMTTYQELRAYWAGISATASVRVLDLIHIGTDAYYASNYVLRHTTNVSARSTYNISDVGVDQIYTTALLLSETTNAGLWRYPLPQRLQIKAMQIDQHFQALYNNYLGGNMPYYTWGWLKSGATESTAANNRINIVSEYEFANWSRDVYYLYP